METRKVLNGQGKPIEEMSIIALQDNVAYIQQCNVPTEVMRKLPMYKARLAIQEWHEQYFAENGAKEGYEKPPTPHELQKAYNDAVALYWEQKDEQDEDMKAMYPNPNEKP